MKLLRRLLLLVLLPGCAWDDYAVSDYDYAGAEYYVPAQGGCPNPAPMVQPAQVPAYSPAPPVQPAGFQTREPPTM